jgi:dihydrolipoamide dehydrogenase
MFIKKKGVIDFSVLPRASDMIAEVEFGASSEDIARTVHGHPTFAEALQEAAMAVRKCSIYAS